eukprot:9230455-Pyramimonas_sp.AAC.1
MGATAVSQAAEGGQSVRRMVDAGCYDPKTMGGLFAVHDDTGAADLPRHETAAHPVCGAEGFLWMARCCSGLALARP